MQAQHKVLQPERQDPTVPSQPTQGPVSAKQQPVATALPLSSGPHWQPQAHSFQQTEVPPLHGHGTMSAVADAGFQARPSVSGSVQGRSNAAGPAHPAGASINGQARHIAQGADAIVNPNAQPTAQPIRQRAPVRGPEQPGPMPFTEDAVEQVRLSSAA